MNEGRMGAYVALSVASIIAAGTFLVARQTTMRFTPLELGWLRIMLSFVLMTAFYLVRIGAWPRLTRADLLRLAALGLLGVTTNQLLFLHGIHLAPAIDGALFYAFTPVLVLVAARMWLGESLTLRKVTGVAIAFAGVYAVLHSRGLALSGEYLTGDLLIGLAVLAWTGYTLLGKAVLRKIGPLTVVTFAFAFGALSMLPLGPSVLGGLDWAKPGLGGWLGLFYLSGLTSVVAFSLYYWALQRLEAGQVAVFTNIQPALTALLAWLFLGELPTWPIVIGGVMIIAGVVLTQGKTVKPTRHATEGEGCAAIT